MKIVHRQQPQEPTPVRKKRRLPALIVVIAAAAVAGTALIAALDRLTPTPQPDADKAGITTAMTGKPTTTRSTTTTTIREVAATTAPTTTPTQPPQPLYVLPLSNQVIAEYSRTPVWNETLQSYRAHQAVDLGGQIGDKVVAVAESTVTAVYTDPLWGGCLELDCGYGITVRYCGIDTDCSVGQTLSVNQAVGTLSEVPCEAAVGTHLHVEISVDGEPVDLLKAIDRIDP